MSETTFGTVEFQGKDICLPAVPYDRLAVGDGGILHLISLVAETQRVKAIRAILAGAAKCVVQASGGLIRSPKAPESSPPRQPGSLTPVPEGYHGYVHKLDYGLAHAMFISRRPGFLRVVTDESLWIELNDSRFTTPLLREWLPYLRRRLVEKGLLEEAEVLNCSCAVLHAHSGDLDAIVSEGLQAGEIRIA